MNTQAEATPHSNLVQSKSWWLYYKVLESGFKPELAEFFRKEEKAM